MSQLEKLVWPIPNDIGHLNCIDLNVTFIIDKALASLDHLVEYIGSIAVVDCLPVNLFKLATKLSNLALLFLA